MNPTNRRLLLVHAHPDDETINNGATMAKYASEGVHVTLLTCTLGELGEILVPALIELEADRGDQLGGYRIGELAAAMAALGVTDHRFLGGAGRFHDSGMMGTPGNDSARAFWRADRDPEVFTMAVRAAVEVIREVRAQVVVTYDPNGGYGHPDHIMTHRVTTAAVAAAADPDFSAEGAPWAVSKLYWTVIPRSFLQAGIDALREAGSSPFFGIERPEDFGFLVEDDQVTATVDASDYVAAKYAAMRAHATQIAVDGPFFALSNHLGQMIWGAEHYRLVLGKPGEVGADGRESDLFAGIT